MKYLRIFESFSEDRFRGLGKYLQNFISSIMEPFIYPCEITYEDETVGSYAQIHLVYNHIKIRLSDIDDKRIIAFGLAYYKEDITSFIQNVINSMKCEKFNGIDYDKIEEFKNQITKENFELFLQMKKYNL